MRNISISVFSVSDGSFVVVAVAHDGSVHAAMGNCIHTMTSLTAKLQVWRIIFLGLRTFQDV